MDSSNSAPPRGYHTVNPYLVVDGAEALIAFLAAAFGATEKERITQPGGRIGHAEVQIGDSVVMVTDGSATSRPQPSTCYAFVADVDATYARALAARATSLSPPDDKFYGNREAGFIDPCGNTWWIATAFEDVPSDELQSRYERNV